MLTKAGLTARPNWLNYFEGFHRYPGDDKSRKFTGKARLRP